MVVMLLTINMVPTLSTLIVIGYVMEICMLSNSCATNILLKASDKAMYSASELERHSSVILIAKRLVHLVHKV